MRESQKPLVYDAAERFGKVFKKEFPPEIIVLFASQGAVAYDSDDPMQKRLALYVFDVSPRIPGCPYVGPTFPEMRRLSLKYQWSMRQLGIERISAPMDLPVFEIKYAAEKKILDKIVT